MSADHAFRSLLHAASISAVSSFLSRAVTIFVSIIMARSLAKDDYGAYAFALGSAYLLANVASFGLGTYATKITAERRNNSDELRDAICGLQWLVAIALAVTSIFAVAAPLELTVGVGPYSNELMKGCIFFVAAFSFYTMQSAVLVGLELYRKLAQINIIIALVGLLVQVPLAYLSGPGGALLGLAFSQMIGCVLAQKHIASAGRLHWSDYSKIVPGARAACLIAGRALPVFLSGFLVVPITWLLNIMLISSAQGEAEVAVLALAAQWRMGFLFLPGILAGLALSKMVGFYASRDFKSFKKFLLKSLLLNASIVGGLLPVAFIASAFVVEIYGEQYRGDGDAFVGLSVVAALMAINNVIGNVLLCAGRFWLGLVFNLLWAIVVLCAAYCFIVMLGMGAIGAVYAYLLSYFAHTVWQVAFLIFFFRYEGMRK